MLAAFRRTSNVALAYLITAWLVGGPIMLFVIRLDTGGFAPG